MLRRGTVSRLGSVIRDAISLPLGECGLPQEIHCWDALVFSGTVRFLSKSGSEECVALFVFWGIPAALRILRLESMTCGSSSPMV